LVAQVDHACPRWRRSSHSGGGTNCVEVAALVDAVAVRDSKDPAGPALVFTPAEIGAFVGKVKSSQI
jgi:hypothetical protein